MKLKLRLKIFTNEFFGCNTNTKKEANICLKSINFRYVSYTNVAGICVMCLRHSDLANIYLFFYFIKSPHVAACKIWIDGEMQPA